MLASLTFIIPCLYFEFKSNAAGNNEQYNRYCDQKLLKPTFGDEQGDQSDQTDQSDKTGGKKQIG